MLSLLKLPFKGLHATVSSFLMLKTYWALIKFTTLLYGAIGIYSQLKTWMEITMWHLHIMWHTIPEGAANFTGLGIFKQVSSLSFEFFMRIFNAHLITLLISVNVLLTISLIISIYYILRKSAPKPVNTEWQGMWRGLGETLERWKSSVSWNFTPEHLKDPENLNRYLRQECRGSGRSEEAQIIWGLANAYRALFNTILERERVCEIEKESLRETVQNERESLLVERNSLQSERDALRIERDSLQSKLNSLQSQQDTLQSELDTLIIERDRLRAELEDESIGTDQPDQLQEAPQLMSLAPVRGRKMKRISTQLEEKKEEDRGPEGWLQDPQEAPLSPGEGPSVRPRSPAPMRATRSPERVRGEQDIVTIVDRSLKMNEIRSLRKDFSRHPNEPIATWLLRCWDNGANSVWLDSREARQLGGIARDSAIDRGISTCQNQAFTLWKRMLLAVKERYPFKDDLMPEKKKWADMEEGICYLREYAVVEMLHSPDFIPDEPDQEHDPERVRCTPNMWRTFTKTAPERYASTFAAMYGRGERRPLISELVNKLQDFELHLSPLRACVSAITKVAEKLDRMENKQEDIIDKLSTVPEADKSMEVTDTSNGDQNSQNSLLEGLINLISSQPVASNVSAIKRRRSPARASDNSKTTSRFALWHYLRDHGEDMKEWHKQPTPVLQARVRELQDKSTTKVNFSKKVIAPVAADNEGNK